MKAHPIKKNKWYDMWKDQQSSHTRSVDSEYRNRFAQEMLVLIGDVSGKSVLEFGCGDGLMYESFGFDKANYLGVDFSDALLEKFENNYQMSNFKSLQLKIFSFIRNLISYFHADWFNISAHLCLTNI